MSGDDGEWLAPNGSHFSNLSNFSNASTSPFATYALENTTTSPLAAGASQQAFGTGSIVSLVFFVCSTLYFTAHFAYFRRRS
jgi:hypothetical protein